MRVKLGDTRVWCRECYVAGGRQLPFERGERLGRWRAGLLGESADHRKRVATFVDGLAVGDAAVTTVTHDVRVPLQAVCHLR